MNRLRNYFVLFFGTITVGLIFYMRVLRVRLPRELHAYLFINDNIINNTNIIFLGILIIGITLIRLIILIRNNYIKKSPSKYIMYLLNKLNIFGVIFKDILYEFYLKVTNFLFKIFKITDVYTFYEIICSYLFYNYTQFYLYIILFKVLPRLIVSLIFFIDIFIYFKLDYFYKSLIILLVPLLYELFILILDDFATANVINLETRIYKEEFNIGTPEQYQKIHLKNPEDWLSKDPKAFYITVQKYRNVLTFKKYFESYYKFETLYFKFITTIIFNCCILVGWVYILSVNIILFFL